MMRARVPGSSLQGFLNVLVPPSYGIQILSRVPLGWICQQCRRRSTAHKTLEAVTKPGNVTSRLPALRINGKNHSRFFSESRIHDNAQLSSKDSSDHDLPSKQEFRRSKTSRQLSHMMDNIQANIFVAGQRLNDLTGYSAIETLKKEIQGQEALVQSTRKRFQTAKENYTRAINQRSQSQREVNELLQRKHAWSPQDLERFTELYRSDHANEQAEIEAQAAVTQAEHAAEEAATKLSANILARYHEEQIWSDKIRRMSTWGTWGLMGVNVLLFLIFQIGVEPWRRKRLVKGFEDKVVEALEKETAAQRSLVAAATTPLTVVQENSPPHNPEAISVLDIGSAAKEVIPNLTSPGGVLADSTDTDYSPIPAAPDDWSSRKTWTRYYNLSESQLGKLFSEQRVEVRQVDITTKFIEGAISSAVIISLLSAMLR